MNVLLCRWQRGLWRGVVLTIVLSLVSQSFLFSFDGALDHSTDPASDQSLVQQLPSDPPQADTETETIDESKAATDKSNRYRILPIPIFITEPAIGNGLGVALTLFHPVPGETDRTKRVGTPTSIGQIDDDTEPPPVVTAVFGAYTSNKTWAAGIAHTNHWREDSIRYAGVVAGAHVNSEFYVFGLPVRYSMEGVLVYQDVKFRVGQSNFFLGAGLSYMNVDFALRTDSENIPPAGLLDANVKNIGVALRGFYDTRSNVMNPDSGQLFELSTWRYDSAIGGSYDYWSGKLKALSFHSLGEKTTLGLRLEVDAVDGSPPFFGYPWVKLRGIPAMRYQNKVAGAAEIEGRYQWAPKWQALAFAGYGFTSDDVPFFDNPKSIYSFGTGVRYQVLESHKVWMGIDIARGPDEWAWYIQVGHPW